MQSAKTSVTTISKPRLPSKEICMIQGSIPNGLNHSPHNRNLKISTILQLSHPATHTSPAQIIITTQQSALSPLFVSPHPPRDATITSSHLTYAGEYTSSIHALTRHHSIYACSNTRTAASSHHSASTRVLHSVVCIYDPYLLSETILTSKASEASCMLGAR